MVLLLKECVFIAPAATHYWPYCIDNLLSVKEATGRKKLLHRGAGLDIPEKVIALSGLWVTPKATSGPNEELMGLGGLIISQA